MNGGLIHNKKFNLLAFLSMGLFLLIGFIDIFSWIFIMLPVVVCFYVYDIRHAGSRNRYKARHHISQVQAMNLHVFPQRESQPLLRTNRSGSWQILSFWSDHPLPCR